MSAHATEAPRPRDATGAVAASAIAAPVLANRPTVRTVYAWELRKLLAQKRTYIGFGCAVLVPLIFIASLLADSGGPEGIPFGDYVRESGLAIPLVGLFFGAFWFFPLVTALVAGDIVATEDGNGTLKTILTRSVDRWQIFVAKVLAAFTYAFAALVLFVGVGLIIGGIIWGFDPLVSLSGNKISVERSLLLLGATTLAYFLPTMAVASLAILLSTVTRNSAAAVVATLMLSLIMQLLAIVSALDFLRPYLLPEQFNAWQGLLRDPIDWAPVVRAAWVSALFGSPCLAWAFTYFIRRDVTGG
ncbi:MAG TPA: ABC transporter permease [Solirubrobacter sp.]